MSSAVRMMRFITPRPWVCSRCVQRLSQVRPTWSISTVVAGRDVSPNPPVDLSTSATKRDDQLLRLIFDSPDIWKAFPKPVAPRVGLFRNSFLQNAEGFLVYARTSLARAKKLEAKILKASTFEEYRGIVWDLDRLSDLLCRVIDLCDFVRSTHPDLGIQKAASEAWYMVYQYMNQLNTTTGLNDQLGTAMADPAVTANWSEEVRMVAEILRQDFSKSAVNLPKESRDRFVSLSQEISEVGAAFVDNMAPEHGNVSLPSDKFLGMDPTSVGNFLSRGRVTLPSMSPEALMALRTVRNPTTRKALYSATRTASSSTVKRLEKLLRLRSELARLAGFETYAHMTLRDRMMAKSPESVRQFLLALADNNAPRVRQEMADVLDEKRKEMPSENPALLPWDKDYYMEAIWRSMRSGIKHDAALSSFFSVGTVMQGISRLFERLYGVRFVPREVLSGETWHPDVRRLDVVSDTDGHVAVLYCDLFFRPDKSPNPAHFTIRCSRKIWDSELQETARETLRVVANGSGHPDELITAASDGMAWSRRGLVPMQLPTIALVCDFAPSSAGAPALLTFHQVETLFHEMGHALHSILARTSLQNVAGTRCATDLAELPSTLMEHFAADPDVLAMFARHYETDAPLNYQLVADRLRQAKRFEGSDDENQIILAMLDQACHSTWATEDKFNTTAIYHELQRTVGNTPPDLPETRWQGFFGHLFGYGSTYYSYLFDRVLAERIWKVGFSSGEQGAAINRKNGEHLKESLLKWGGSRDPWQCVSDALRDPRIAQGDEQAMGLVGSWGTGGSFKP